MEVLYDYQIFARQRDGGVTRYFFEIIRRIAASKDTDVYVFQGLHMSNSNCRTLDGLKGYFGLRRPVVPFTMQAFDKINQMLFEGYEKGMRLGHRVYHPTFYSSSIERMRGPVVLTVFDMIAELFPPENRNWRWRRHLEAKREAIYSSDHLVCISNATKNDLQALYGVEENKVSVIHLASSITSVAQNAAGSTNSIIAPYVIYVGNRGGYKNFRTLALAFAQRQLFRDFSLVCFGGRDFSRSEMDDFRNLGIENSVHHWGGDDAALAAAYARAEVLVYPSLYEGFGLPLLEAMSMGCPVIGANRGSIGEIVGTAGVLFDAASSEDLGEALLHLLHSPSLREEYKRRGRERAKQFSWDSTADRTLDVYKALV